MDLLRPGAVTVDLAAEVSHRHHPLSPHTANGVKQASAGLRVCACVCAWQSGGNIETTRANEVYRTEHGVTCIGYTDMPSRLPTTASTLLANNLTKFLLSVGPQTTGVKDRMIIDHQVPTSHPHGSFTGPSTGRSRSRPSPTSLIFRLVLTSGLRCGSLCGAVAGRGGPRHPHHAGRHAALARTTHRTATTQGQTPASTSFKSSCSPRVRF